MATESSTSWFCTRCLSAVENPGTYTRIDERYDVAQCWLCDREVPVCRSYEAAVAAKAQYEADLRRHHDSDRIVRKGVPGVDYSGG